MAHKHKKTVFWGILATEVSHVFCCVLPMLFSLASLLATFGLVIIMPAWLETLHNFMHEWELHAISAAALVLALGWGLHLYSYKEDCHDHGCAHEPCTPRKNQASIILKIATGLFILNVTIFVFLHDGAARIGGVFTGGADIHHAHDGHDH